jgi:hypothetical protein
MREKILRAAVFVRFALVGVIIVTSIMVDCRKFPSPTQVIGQDEMDGLCQTVQGCKSLRAVRTYGDGTPDAGIRFIATQDKKAKSRDFRDALLAGIDHLWNQNVHRWSAPRDLTLLEVRGE